MTSMWIIIGAALQLAAGDVAGPVPTPAAAAESPVAVTARLLDAQGQEVRKARLADRLTLELVISGPPGATFFPPFRPAVGAFELLEPRPPTKGGTAEAPAEIWRYDVLAVRLGVERVPPIEVPYRLADGTEGSTSTPIVRVDVEGHLVNDANPALAPPPRPVPIITTDWALIWAVSIAGTLLIAALLAFFVLKALEARFRGAAPPAPPRPANEVALERLEAIARDDGLDGSARHAALVDTLRAYLAGRYGFDALEMTSRETLAALESVDLKTISQADVAALLNEADLIKFASLAFDDGVARARTDDVRRIVTETWEAPVVETQEDEPRLEAATLRQRFMAGGIDVLLALIPGVAIFVALWWFARLDLGWLAFVATGLVLALRDAGGRSPGKRLLGLSIAMRDERQSPAGFAARWKRNALLVVWPVTLPLEALTLRQHPLAARIGDLAAQTAIVQGQRAAATVNKRRRAA
jgi:uncharacterized RDD family membrane protein YckC